MVSFLKVTMDYCIIIFRYIATFTAMATKRYFVEWVKRNKIYGNGVFKATVAEFFKFSHRN